MGACNSSGVKEGEGGAGGQCNELLEQSVHCAEIALGD